MRTWKLSPGISWTCSSRKNATRQPVSGLKRHESHARSHKDGGSPTAAATALMQEEAGGYRVRHKGQGSGSGGHKAEISPREAEQQAVETDGHRRDAEGEGGGRKNAADDVNQAAAAPQIGDIPHLLHRMGKKHV